MAAPPVSPSTTTPEWFPNTFGDPTHSHWGARWLASAGSAAAARRCSAAAPHLHRDDDPWLAARLASDHRTMDADFRRFGPSTCVEPATRQLLCGISTTTRPELDKSAMAALAIGGTSLLRSSIALHLEPGYAQGMHWIAAFCLRCATTESEAEAVFSTLVHHVMPRDFWSRPPAGMNGATADVHVVASLLIESHRALAAKHGSETLELFVTIVAMKAMVPIFIGEVQLLTALAIWDALFAAAGEMEHPSTTTIAAMIALFDCVAPRLATSRDLIALVTTAQLELLRVGPEAFHDAVDAVNERWSAAEIEARRVAAKRSLAAKWESPHMVRDLTMVGGTANALSPVAVETLREHYLRVKDRRKVAGDAIEGGLRRDEFEEVIDAVLFRDEVACATAYQSNALFKLMDRDGDGTVDLREMVVSLATVCSGSLEARLALCFEMFDADDSGYLENVELDAVLHVIDVAANGRDGLASPLRRSIGVKLRLADVDGDGRLSFDEFHDACMHDTALQHAFGCRLPGLALVERGAAHDAADAAVSAASFAATVAMVTAATVVDLTVGERGGDVYTPVKGHVVFSQPASSSKMPLTTPSPKRPSLGAQVKARIHSLRREKERRRSKEKGGKPSPCKMQ